MRQTRNKTIVLHILTCVSLLLLFGANIRAQNDVSPGMKIEDAILIARNSVHESSGVRVDKIRPSDTLEFLGVTDELRLDSLRRYIVRNVQVGVQSIWAYPEDDTNVERLAQHYIISNSAFDEISKNWTVEKLARTISANAGIPFLTYSKTSQIVADCREAAGNKNNEPAISTPIKGDIVNGKKFADCLIDGVVIDGVEKGVKSAKITAPEGNIYSYTFSEQAAAGVLDKIEKGTYEDLIKFIKINAQAPLSPKLTASVVVTNAILNVLEQKNNKNLRTIVRNKNPGVSSQTFRLIDLINEISNRTGSDFEEDYTLDYLGITDIERFKREIENALNETLLIQGKNTKIAPLEARELSDLKLDINSKTTIRQVVNIVAELIQQQLNKR